MGNRYGVRAFLIYDTHQVELPNHDAAIDNLDRTNLRLLIVRDRKALARG